MEDELETEAAVLTPAQHTALEAYARELHGLMRAGAPEAAIAWEGLRRVLGILAYDLIWEAGDWHLEERDAWMKQQRALPGDARQESGDAC